MACPLHISKGQQFGKLCVVKEVDPHTYPDGRRARRFKVLCTACGKSRCLLLASLRNGKEHCGCLTSAALSKGSTRHGLYKHPAYFTYRGMMNRCYATTHPDYKNYGARGITVCKSWYDPDSGVRRFCEWWDAQPKSAGDTLDRKNNSKGYSPSNCRFAPPKIQAANRRSTILIKGQPFRTAHRELIGPKARYDVALHRYHQGMSFKNAVRK